MWLVMMVFDLLRWASPTGDARTAGEARGRMLGQLGMAVVIVGLLITIGIAVLIVMATNGAFLDHSEPAPVPHHNPWAKD
jgi:hypothetical protein